MRLNLQPLSGKVCVFEGTSGGYSHRMLRYGGNVLIATLLLHNVRLNDSDETLSDHCWVDVTPNVQKRLSRIKDGSVIRLEARVMPYLKGSNFGGKKGYHGFEETHFDYKLDALRVLDVAPQDEVSPTDSAPKHTKAFQYATDISDLALSPVVFR